MKGKTKASRRKLFVTLFLCLVGVAALAAYVKFSPPTIAPNERLTGIAPQSQDIQVPVPKVDDQANLELGNQSATVAKGESAYLAAVNGFLATLDSKTPWKADSVEIDHKVARVHFREGFGNDLGSRDEATFLLGLRAAFGQFAEIESVELYVEGQKLDELGHISLDIPQPVIRPSNWKNPTNSGTEPDPQGQH